MHARELNLEQVVQFHVLDHTLVSVDVYVDTGKTIEDHVIPANERAEADDGTAATRAAGQHAHVLRLPVLLAGLKEGLYVPLDERFAIECVKHVCGHVKHVCGHGMTRVCG